MIIDFKCKHTENLWTSGKSKKLPPEIARISLRKLVMIHNAFDLKDLASPPGNHLENLNGDRHEQYSIRINKRWRICFCWKNRNASQVEIIDYH